MDRDLDVKSAFDSIETILSRVSIRTLRASEASAILKAVGAADDVFQVLL